MVTYRGSITRRIAAAILASILCLALSVPAMAQEPTPPPAPTPAPTATPEPEPTPPAPKPVPTATPEPESAPTQEPTPVPDIPATATPEPAPALISEPPPEPTEAAEPEEDDRQGIVGTVTAISADGGTITITRKDGTEYQVNVAGMGLEVAVGDRVGILAQVGEEGQPLIAVRALKVPNKPMQEHITGTVVERTATTITIVDAEGNERTIQVHPKADLSVEAGEVITTVAGPGRSATAPGKLRKAS